MQNTLDIIGLRTCRYGAWTTNFTGEPMASVRALANAVEQHHRPNRHAQAEGDQGAAREGQQSPSCCAQVRGFDTGRRRDQRRNEDRHHGRSQQHGKQMPPPPPSANTAAKAAIFADYACLSAELRSEDAAGAVTGGLRRLLALAGTRR
jgi:hypothetical protein